MSRLSDKRRILVVDDDPKLAAFVNSQLKAHGFDVEWARDGR